MPRAYHSRFRADGWCHCPRCLTYKPPSEYSVCNRHSTKLQSYCRTCAAEYKREWNRKMREEERRVRDKALRSL